MPNVHNQVVCCLETSTEPSSHLLAMLDEGRIENVAGVGLVIGKPLTWIRLKHVSRNIKDSERAFC